MTDDLEFHIIELLKLKTELTRLNTDFESWLFTLKHGHELKGEEMNTLTKKNPKLKKLFKEYAEYSSDPKNKNYIEARKKSQLVLNSQIRFAEQQANLKTSVKLLKVGMSPKEISEITGLTKKQILEFQKSQEK